MNFSNLCFNALKLNLISFLELKKIIIFKLMFTQFNSIFQDSEVFDYQNFKNKLKFLFK